MGQLVSTSSVVVDVSVGGPSQRPFFVEFNGSFVPVLNHSVLYTVRFNKDLQNVECVLQGDRETVRVALQKRESSRSYQFQLQKPCRGGFYRLQCLDVDTVVWVDSMEPAVKIDGLFNQQPPGQLWLPDGTQFRNALASLEDSVASLQKSSRWKIILESLTRLSDLLRSVSSVCDGLVSTRVSFAGDQQHPLKTLFNDHLHTWVRSYNENHIFKVSQALSNDLIAPLQEFIEFEKQNQKLLPKKQKNFHEAVRLMYSSQSSLSFNNKIHYDLARLEYQNFLNQCYIVGPPLRKLYMGMSHFLQRETLDTISQFNDNYTRRNHQLRSSIKNAQSLNDLTKLYSAVNSPHLETYVSVNFQEGETANINPGASGGGGSSGGSHWHRKWVILDGTQLSVFHHSKKTPLHNVDLSFACIKQINRTTIEILTSGLPSVLPTLAMVNSSSSSVEYQSGHSKNHRSKVFLQFKDPTEADHWLTLLKQANQDTKLYSGSAAGPSSTDDDSASTNKSLIDLVMGQHESNSTCCDCGDSQTVEWISINLLCVLCIKCSGVHRSMGSHISKVRSLTLDSFTSPEILHLLQNNVSNSNVNSIYEANHSRMTKLTPQSSDAERSHYIIGKYQGCKMVSDGNQDAKTSLKSLIKAIHLDSIYLLQKTIAQSKLSLKDVVSEQSRSDEDDALPTIFQYSLKHHEMIQGKPVFVITEFLLYNGLPVDKLPNDTSNWSPTVIEYWKNKFDMYGVFSSAAFTPKPRESTESTLAPLSIPAEKQPSRRWTLNHMPSSPQIKSPTNILNMHKSLKLTKRSNGSKKD